MKTLDIAKVAESAPYWKDSIPAMQTAVFVMAGGGALGRMAAEQPADFYIDSRGPKLPYNQKELNQAVKVLCTIAEQNGFNSHKLPPMPQFHNFGIF